MVRKDGRSGVSKRPGARDTGAGFPMDQKAMSTNEPTTQEGTATELTDFDARPEDCDCNGVLDTLPCWPCYRDGFDAPNPSADKE